MAAASAAAVLALFLPFAVWGLGSLEAGQSDPTLPIAPPETIAPVPSTEATTEHPGVPWECPAELRGSEVEVDDAEFPIQVDSPVLPGGTVAIQILPPDGSPGRVTSPAVTFQCWNGDIWVDSHLLHTATLAGDGSVLGAPWIAETDELWWVQAVGLSVPHKAVALIPEVPPGTYRIVVSISSGRPGDGAGLTSFVLIEVTTESTQQN